MPNPPGDPSIIRGRPANPRQRRTGLLLLLAGFLIGMVGLVYLTGTGGAAEDQRDVALTSRNEIAQDARDDAVTIAALCRTQDEVAQALDAAGQCGRAQERLADPVISGVTTGLSSEQIDNIVSRVRASSPPGASVEEIVTVVLAQLRADTTLAALTEADVRAVVLAVIAEQPQPRDGRDGRDGASFGGVVFVRQDGRCVSIATIIQADGSMTTQTSPVGDAACSNSPDPPPSGPPPGSTPEPAPPDPTTAPPVETSPPSSDPPGVPPTDPAPAPESTAGDPTG